MSPGVSHALVPPSGTTQLGADPHCHIGDLEYYGLAGFGETGRDKIHVTKAELLGVPAGLQILAVNSVSIVESRKTAVGWASQKDWDAQGYNTMPIHAVSAIELDPTVNEPNWWILVKLKVEATGMQSTRGLKLSYTAGGRAGTATFNYEVATVCGRPDLSH